MIIGIDIDDTITETSLMAKSNLAKFDNSYQDYHKLPKERYVEFMHKYQGYGLKNASLKEGVKEAFQYLRDKGYKIIIITARNNKYTKDLDKITINYLKEHGLVYDKIIFDKESKGLTAKSEGIDLFIDDKEVVLDEMKSVGIDTIRITSDNNSKHKTFLNWYEIIDYIESRG